MFLTSKLKKEGIYMDFKQWRNFNTTGEWTKEIDVRGFIQANYTPYEGDSNFLTSPTEKTKKLWNKVLDLYKKETENNGVLDVDVKTPSSINAYEPGYVDKSLEEIVGFQTDAPLKRAIMPNGGIRIVEKSCESYGYKVDENIEYIYHNLRRTHNDGVFAVYTPDVRAARSSHLITGLPDGYGRGRIIGDYRRVALYGVDVLIEEKKRELDILDSDEFVDSIIKNREEVHDQILALEDLKKMALKYGFDISVPASNAKEAFQWLYFGYLGAIKDQNGAAMSLGRTTTFLDIYVERDLNEGTLSESLAQELMDQFVMKLRMVRFLRAPEYNALFSGDPVWVTEALGGMGIDGRTLVTKNSFRMLHTLVNLGPAPEPNLTVLWSKNLPEGFKKFCADISIKTSSIQYENDDLMRATLGDDYGIACCVSAMKIGKQMQFFGARANLGKTLLYAINGGRDEKSGVQITPEFAPITSEYLNYGEVMEKFDNMMDYVAKIYIKALNAIHYMHDKYSYEALEMALHDSERNILRTMACGIAGLSVVADSLSAIKYAKVKVIRDDTGLAVDYQIDGDFPKYGNDDDREFTGKSSTPKVTLGLNITAAWRGFDLNMTWSGRFGGYHYLNSKGANGSMITNVGDALPGDAWNKFYFYDSEASHAGIIKDENGTIIGSSYDPATDPNANISNEYPRLLTSGGTTPSNTFYLYNTSFFKLKSLQIGYTLPKKWIAPAKISNLRVFVSGENLLTFTKLKGMFDPEAIFTSNTYTSEGGKNYPMNKVLSVGLIVNL